MNKYIAVYVSISASIIIFTPLFYVLISLMTNSLKGLTVKAVVRATFFYFLGCNVMIAFVGAIFFFNDYLLERML